LELNAAPVIRHDGRRTLDALIKARQHTAAVPQTGLFRQPVEVADAILRRVELAIVVTTFPIAVIAAWQHRRDVREGERWLALTGTPKRVCRRVRVLLVDCGRGPIGRLAVCVRLLTVVLILEVPIVAGEAPWGLITLAAVDAGMLLQRTERRFQVFLGAFAIGIPKAERRTCAPVLLRAAAVIVIGCAEGRLVIFFRPLRIRSVPWAVVAGQVALQVRIRLARIQERDGGLYGTLQRRPRRRRLGRLPMRDISDEIGAEPARRPAGKRLIALAGTGVFGIEVAPSGAV
jgi:hypothetical protein